MRSRSNGCWPPARCAARSLTGGLPARPAATLLEQIAAGEIDLVVGTQAVIQEDVRFARLGLVVIDEQHKFGVRQRAMLRHARPGPALPGDDRHAHPPHRDHDAVRRPGRLDLADSPPGRQKVNTYLADEDAARPLVGILPQASSAKGGRATWSRRWSRNRTSSPPSASRRPTRRWPTASWRPFAWA